METKKGLTKMHFSIAAVWAASTSTSRQNRDDAVKTSPALNRHRASLKAKKRNSPIFSRGRKVFRGAEAVFSFSDAADHLHPSPTD